MSTIHVPFATSWEVRLPVVTRYLPKEYVDAFFRDGSLRLSSFAAFRQHPDENQGDDREGLPQVESESPNSKGVFLGVVGQECYILCGTVIENPVLEGSFHSKHGFRILDTVAFAHCIAQDVPRFAGGMEGPCMYRANTAMQGVTHEPFRPPGPQDDPEEFGARLHAQQSDLARGALFIKSPRYAHQSEYRMLWFANGTAREYLDIKCSNALRHCTRLG